MSRPGRPTIIGRAAQVLLLACLTACGEGGPDADVPAEDWPRQLDVPAVLGYLALDVEPAPLVDALEGLLGWRPGGLAEGVPTVVLALDPDVLGGHEALLLPLADQGALEASLEACEHVSRRGDRWTLRLGADHPLVQASLAARRFSTMGGASNPMDMLAGMGGAAAIDFEFELAYVERWAVLAPSFEAVVVTRKMLREVGGLGRPMPPGGVVVAVDLERVSDTYTEQLGQLDGTLRTMLGGAGVASAMFAADRGEGRPWSALAGLEPLWIPLRRMLELDRFTSLSLELDGYDVSELLSLVSGSPGRPAPVTHATPRLRLSLGHDDPSTPLRRVLSALRPAPPVGSRGATEERGGLTLAADADTIVPALVEWCRPVVETALGEGPPAESLLEDMAAALAPWDGSLSATVEAWGANEGGGVLVLGTRPGASFRPADLAAVVDRLAGGLGLAGETSLAEQVGDAPAGRMGEETLYLTLDDAFVLAPAEVDPDDLEAVVDERLAPFGRVAAGAAGDGPPPFLHVDVLQPEVDLLGGVAAEDGLVLELRFDSRTGLRER